MPPCFHPTPLYPTASGKRSKKPPKLYHGEPIYTPCTTCMGCRVAKRTEVGIRVGHELEFYEESRFLTFTYDEDSLPGSGDLVRKDIVNCLKRIRKEYGNGIRFLYNGEYGEQTARPHYHVLAFGLEIEDEEEAVQFMDSDNKFSSRYRTSEHIDHIWNNGNVIIGDGTPSSGAYIGGYMAKDLPGDHDPNKPYTRTDRDRAAVIKGQRPFVGYPNGRNGGLGMRWIHRYHKDVFPHGTVLSQNINTSFKPPEMIGGIPSRQFIKNPSGLMVPASLDQVGNKRTEHPVPRYYIKQLEKIDPHMHAEFIKSRQDYVRTEEYKSENTPERLSARKAAFGGNPSSRRKEQEKTAFVVVPR